MYKRNVSQIIFYLFDALNERASLCCPVMELCLPAVCLLCCVLTCRLEAGQPVSSTLPYSYSIAVIYRTPSVSACLAHVAVGARTTTESVLRVRVMHGHARVE